MLHCDGLAFFRSLDSTLPWLFRSFCSVFPVVPLSACSVTLRTLPIFVVGVLEGLVHSSCPVAPVWRQLPLVLAVAFIVRAVVALTSDFSIHPDEIMQYLEPAHRSVFGSGVVFWEQVYGARSWLVPGLVAVVLSAFDLLGLGQPQWYIPGVKLVFCALSLALPCAMYFAARVHYSEMSARVALVGGALWYELAGFAHKPMTEFLASAFLIVALALALRPAAVVRAASLCPVVALVVLGCALRVQYVALGFIILLIACPRAGRLARGALWVLVWVGVIGLFDAFTTGAGPFHSYRANVQFNLSIAEFRTFESSPLHYVAWLALASVGLSFCLLVGALVRGVSRHALLLGLIALVVAVHALQPHREYRFIFIVIPLWLLVGADVAVMFVRSAQRPRCCAVALAAVFTVVSALGVANALPFQRVVYRAWSHETDLVSFAFGQDPMFAAFRFLSLDPGLRGLWVPDRSHAVLPGYYYLHRAVPFYDAGLCRAFSLCPNVDPPRFVTHVLTSDSSFALAGFRHVRSFGSIRLLTVIDPSDRVERWRSYAPVILWPSDVGFMGDFTPLIDARAGRSGVVFSDAALR